MTLDEELQAALLNAEKTIVDGGRFSLCEALESTDERIRLDAAIHIHRLATNIPTLIRRDSRFPGDKVRMIRGESGALGFYPQFVGEALVRRALSAGSADAAIQWLSKVLETPSADGFSVTALWGVPVSEPVQLTSDVALLPLDQLPDSPQKKWITELVLHGFNAPIQTMLSFDKPTAALVARRRIDPLLHDPADTSIEHDEYLATMEQFSEIELALTAVGPRVPIQAAHWFTFADPDIAYALRGGGRSQQGIEILPSKHGIEVPLDTNEAVEIVGAYLALGGATRDKLRVALKRLSQAQRRRSEGDKAVELCIAFEALLGDNAATEMTHKIKVRLVRLLGGTPDIRSKNAAVMTKTYDIRSKLVHTGRVDATSEVSIAGEKLSAEELMKRASSLCGDLIKAIIRRGAIPEWSSFDVS